VDENPTPIPEPASGPPLGEAPGAGVTPDAGLGEVVAWFEEQGSDLEQILGDVLRQAVDEVLDGQRTGRYDVDQLAKTEKTYLGTKVEIMCESEFGFPRGKHMDYLISGHEVDCKFTLRFGGWAIPREAVGQICLLLHADDKNSRFSAGVVRAFPEALSAGTKVPGDLPRRGGPAGLGSGPGHPTVPSGPGTDRPKIARDLGLPVPAKGSWVSVRVVPRPEGDARPHTLISDWSYVVPARDEKPTPAPDDY
jgi:hypothetical protein